MSDTRAPYSTRLNTSRPSGSAANRDVSSKPRSRAHMTRTPRYFESAVKLRSQAAFDLLTTAFTSGDLISGGLSQYHGITAAVPVTCLSIAAHAFARAVGSVST